MMCLSTLKKIKVERSHARNITNGTEWDWHRVIGGRLKSSPTSKALNSLRKSIICNFLAQWFSDESEKIPWAPQSGRTLWNLILATYRNRLHLVSFNLLQKNWWNLVSKRDFERFPLSQRIIINFRWIKKLLQLPREQCNLHLKTPQIFSDMVSWVISCQNNAKLRYARVDIELGSVWGRFPVFLENIWSETVSGKDTVVVVCVCAWIPTDSGVYPWGSGRDPVGCIVFTDFVRSRYCVLTDVRFDLDDCKGLCCRRVETATQV